MPFGDEMVNFFSMTAFGEKELHADNKCKTLMENLPEGATYHDLPDGPIRQALEKATTKGQEV